MYIEGLSSALGWVSIACWIIVYSPQIIENYKLKSGEGLSVFFVVTWLLGDLCNLAGALMAGLLPTMIILATYYSLCDMILLFQIFYYRRTRQAHRNISVPGVIVSNEEGEESPLLGPASSKKHISLANQIARYLLAFTFVIGTGIIAWGLTQGDGHTPESGMPGKDVIEWKSQLIGWTSALLYLGARIPQIYKNFQTKCEGLSLALFVFAIAGNVTYVSSICTDSMDRTHIIANASWLAGSGLTIFLDLFVLGQFFYYRSVKQKLITEGETNSA